MTPDELTEMTTSKRIDRDRAGRAQAMRSLI